MEVDERCYEVCGAVDADEQGPEEGELLRGGERLGEEDEDYAAGQGELGQALGDGLCHGDGGQRGRGLDPLRHRPRLLLTDGLEVVEAVDEGEEEDGEAEGGEEEPVLNQERQHRESRDGEQPGDDGPRHQGVCLRVGQETDGESCQKDGLFVDMKGEKEEAKASVHKCKNKVSWGWIHEKMEVGWDAGDHRCAETQLGEIRNIHLLFEFHYHI